MDATRTDLAPNPRTNPDATPTVAFEGDDALLLRARLARSGEAADFGPDELARLQRLLDNPGQFSSRFGHRLDQDDLTALGRAVEQRGATQRLDIEIPPELRDTGTRTPGAPRDTQVIPRDGAGQTQPLGRDRAGQTQPLGRDRAGQTQPVTRSIDPPGGTEVTSPGPGARSGNSTLLDAGGAVAPSRGPSVQDLIREARENDVLADAINDVVRSAANADEARAGLRREITRARVASDAYWRRFWQNQDEIADNAVEFARDAGVPEARIAEIERLNPTDSVDRGLALLDEALQRGGYDLAIPSDDLTRLQALYVRGAARQRNAAEAGLTPDDITWLRARLAEDPTVLRAATPAGAADGRRWLRTGTHRGGGQPAPAVL